jgi:pimeloyl-ACP methyl ester carboxylesterase
VADLLVVQDHGMSRVESIMLDVGRRVGVHTLIEGETGRAVVLCHPAPGSGVLDPDPEVSHGRGVTLIGVDRPGYGLSEPMPPGTWSSIDQAADDLAEVLNGRTGGPVGVAGWSEGGLVALALAARHPQIVDRLAVIAAPALSHEVDPILPCLRTKLEMLRDQPAKDVHEEVSRWLAAAAPDDPITLLHISGADEAALASPGARQRLANMLDMAFAHGTAGLAADIAGCWLRPWGFEPEQVTAKTLLLYGAEDPMAGPRHGKWWKQRVPNSRYEQVPGAGHLLLLTTWSRVLSHLAPGTKRPAQRPR